VAIARIINEWNDAAGGFLRTAGWVDDTTSVSTFQNALEACSNDALTHSTFAVPRAAAQTATAALYYLTTDAIRLTYLTATPGLTISLIIPGPQSSVFLPDGVTVDPGSTLIAALTAAATTGSLTASGGQPATLFFSGVKTSRRTEQNAPPD
jgi:hypothetical protein